MSDYEDGNWSVTIRDTSVPSGGRFVARMQRTDGESKFLIKYVYGYTYDEALENAKKMIAEYK